MVAPNSKNLMTQRGTSAEAYRQVLRDHPDFFQQVANYCMLGAEDEQLGAFFGYDREMWRYWLKHSQELRDAVIQGTHMADADVAAAMYKRAVGYEYKRQTLVISKEGHATVHDLTEHVPPDTAAGKFWLTNRSKKWAEKQEHEHSGVIDTEITVKFVGTRETINVTNGDPDVARTALPRPALPDVSNDDTVTVSDAP